MEGKRSLGSLIYMEKGGLECGGRDGMRKIKTKEGCVFEREWGNLEI